MEELIATVVTAVIGYAVVEVRKYLKSKVTPSQLHTVSQLARVFVDGADEVGRAADGITPGEKFTYAEKGLKNAAKRVGIKLSDEEANGFIHAALTGKRDDVQEAVEAAMNEFVDGLDLGQLVGEDEAA